MKSLCLGLLLFAASAWPQTNTATYYVGFLRPNPARQPLAKDEGERIQTAHMANINKMADEGRLVSAGPFGDTPTTISGIFVLKAASLEEATRIANQDPTVVEHRNTIDVHQWQGPAGIGDEYFRLHKADPKMPEGMGPHPLVIFYPGPNWKPGSEAVAESIATLRKAGKLAAAGVIEGNDTMKALLIFNRIPAPEEIQVIENLHAVKAGILKPEHHIFYSSTHVFPW